MSYPRTLIEALRDVRRVAVLTGAGVSAECGIPTFRQAQTGLWAKYDPHELATPAAFRRNPGLVWSWYTWRRQLVRQAEPNPGHRALVRLEDLVPTFHLITQNVDGLHRRAGSQRVIELHGNLNRVRCSQDGTPIEKWDQETEEPPKCPHCGALGRPDVVWFGEALPTRALDIAFAAAQECEVFLSIGTSTLVQPAASLPFQALSTGATVIEINPEETPLSSQADFVLRGASGAILPDLVAQIWPPDPAAGSSGDEQ